MVSDGVVFALQAVHVFFSSALFIAAVYQGLLGWRIRGRRVAGVLQDFSIVKRHRRLGPILAALLPLTFLAGLSTAYLHRGLWLRFPGHFAAGTVLLAILYSTVLVSKRIRGAQSPWRTPHFELGVLLLLAFLIQIFLGLDVLL